MFTLWNWISMKWRYKTLFTPTSTVENVLKVLLNHEKLVLILWWRPLRLFFESFTFEVMGYVRTVIVINNCVSKEQLAEHTFNLQQQKFTGVYHASPVASLLNACKELRLDKREQNKSIRYGYSPLQDKRNPLRISLMSQTKMRLSEDRIMCQLQHRTFKRNRI